MVVRGRSLAPACEELLSDITLFQTRGVVVLLGDFNCRVGTLSTIINEELQVVFERHSQDVKVPEQAAKIAKLFVDTMNSCDMLVMNGLDNGGDFTFESSNTGASV